MKYTLKDEYKIFEEEPELRQFREKILSKPNGPVLYDTYLNFRVMQKNDEDFLNRMDPNSSSYQQVKDMVDRKFKKLQEMENELDAPLNLYGKIKNAPIITTDWFDKTLDIVKNAFSHPSEEEQQQSQKPSLWNVFWK